MKKISVNMVSDFNHGPKGHGLYVAFHDAKKLAKSLPDFDVYVNSDKKTDIIHSHSFLPYYVWKVLGRKSKRILTLHVVPDSLKESFALSKYWLPFFRKYLKFVCNISDVVICVAPLEKNKLKELGVKSRIEIIPNYIQVDKKYFDDKDRAERRKKYNIGQHEMLIISVGQQIKRKGIFEFIETAKHLPNNKFVWVGGVPYKTNALSYRGDKIAKAIKDAPDNIIFTGNVERGEVFRWLHAADIMLFASRQEIHPLVVIEAAAFGLPLVMKDLKEYRETFFDYFIKANEWPAMVKGLKNLINNPNTFKDYQARSKKISELYNKQTIGNKIINLYRELIGK